MIGTETTDADTAGTRTIEHGLPPDVPATDETVPTRETVVVRPSGRGARISADPIEGLHGVTNTIFERLVGDENDVVGLLAYSLSMQNKRDWLGAFREEIGREPTDAEMTAYDVGERIERRLATYRKLAEAALSGNSAWASATLTPVSELPGAPHMEPERSVAPVAPVSRTTPRGSVSARGRVVGGLVIFAVLVVGVLAARQFLGI